MVSRTVPCAATASLDMLQQFPNEFRSRFFIELADDCCQKVIVLSSNNVHVRRFENFPHSPFPQFR